MSPELAATRCQATQLESALRALPAKSRRPLCVLATLLALSGPIPVLAQSAPPAQVKAPSGQEPESRARLGTPCTVHPHVRLLADLVPAQYGFAGFDRYQTPDEHRLFPNACRSEVRGCVVGERYAEVAYCSECRRQLARHRRAHGERDPKPRVIGSRRLPR